MSKDNSDYNLIEKYKRESSSPFNRERLYPIYLKNRNKYPLPFSEYEIHHIDFNKDNNDVRNLILLTPAEHDAIHIKKMQKVQSQKKEIEMIAKVRAESEKAEKEREKEMRELEKEKKRLESHKRETHRRRLRQYEDQRRIMFEREKNRTHSEKEEEKITLERIKEREKSQNKKRKNTIKSLTKGVMILFLLVVLIVLYTILNQYMKEHPNTSIDPEGTSINLTYQQIASLCEEGCEKEGGFMNSYYNTPKEVGCTCIDKRANGENIIKIFDKIKVRWIN
jgi:hypothetical protein